MSTFSRQEKYRLTLVMIPSIAEELMAPIVIYYPFGMNNFQNNDELKNHFHEMIPSFLKNFVDIQGMFYYELLLYTSVVWKVT